MNDVIESLTHDQMVELLEIYAKNLVALDGTWFQSVERDDGMDAAMHHDREAWRRFSVSEARRIKKFLGWTSAPASRVWPARSRCAASRPRTSTRSSWKATS